MHSDIYDPVLFKLGMMIATAELYICSPSDLNLDSRPQVLKKDKNFCTIYFKQFLNNLDWIWDVVETSHHINLSILCSCLINIKGRGPYIGYCVTKKN